jgi:GDP-L-fucose synthase
MQKNSKIYVAGHRGLVGSAIVENLKSKGYTNIIGKTHAELDLLDQKAVADFFESEKPEYVFLAAAKVGGIIANNTFRAPSKLYSRCKEASVFGKYMYLSKRGSTAYERG